MTALERNVKQTQFRLGLNDWFQCLGWCLLALSAVWVLLILTNKLFDLSLPLLTLMLIGLGLALGVSAFWARAKRRDLIAAATVLDESAGLNERTSSGLYCQSHQDDPFAQAALADAEDFNNKISPRSFIRFVWPTSLSFASLAILVAAIMTWIPISPIQAEDKEAKREVEEQRIVPQKVKQAQTRLASLRTKAEKNPALKELKNQLKTIDNLDVEKLSTTESVRREEIKKLDSFTDSVRKQHEEQQNRMKELKRMFRGMKHNQQPKTPLEKLSKAMSKGDFRAAKEAVKELQEQLAKMKQNPDEQQQKNLKDQLEKLAQQLNEKAKQQEQKKELQKELEQAGVDPETAKRALENLTKKDQQKMKEQMQKKGADQQKMKDMMQKMANQQQCQKSGQDMASSMQKAAQAMQSDSSMSDAAEQLQEMSDQLNAMEGMSQQVSELESLLADAQDMKNDAMNDGDSDQCTYCSGKGCGMCNGTGKKGSGMGKRGQGRGGRAKEQETGVRFKKVRTPVVTAKGSIISKMFVEGEQVKGGVSKSAAEVLSAAEREATDAINKNKIPNLYRSPVKGYFTNLKQDVSEENNVEDSDSSDDSAAEN